MSEKRPGVWIDGKFVDMAHVPAWYGDVRPSLGEYDADGNLIRVDRRSLDEAAANEALNRGGRVFIETMLWVTIGLFAVAAVWFVVLLTH